MNDAAAKRNALIALLIITPAPSIGAYLACWVARGTAVGSVGYALGKIVLYGLPIVWLLLVDRRRPSASPPRQGGFAAATGLGVLVGATIWAAWALFIADRIDLGVIRTVVAEAGLDTRGAFIAGSLWLICVNSVLEEYAFRWFVFTRARALMPAGAAVLVSAAIFAAHHVIVLRAFVPWDITLVGTAGVFVGGAVWSWCYHRYASIWPGALSHAIADVAILSIGWQVVFG